MKALNDWAKAYGNIRTVLTLAAEATRSPKDHLQRFYRVHFEDDRHPGRFLNPILSHWEKRASLDELLQALLWRESKGLGDTEEIRVIDPCIEIDPLLSSVEPLLAGSDPEWPKVSLSTLAGWPYGLWVQGDGNSSMAPDQALQRYQSDRSLFISELKSTSCRGWKSTDRDGVLFNNLLFCLGDSLHLMGAVKAYSTYF